MHFDQLMTAWNSWESFLQLPKRTKRLDRPKRTHFKNISLSIKLYSDTFIGWTNIRLHVFSMLIKSSFENHGILEMSF